MQRPYLKPGYESKAPKPGDIVPDGTLESMDPSGNYANDREPRPFTVTTTLTIESDVRKEWNCSDHFFVITSTPYFGGWSGECGPLAVMRVGCTMFGQVRDALTRSLAARARANASRAPT